MFHIDPATVFEGTDEQIAMRIAAAGAWPQVAAELNGTAGG